MDICLCTLPVEFIRLMYTVLVCSQKFRSVVLAGGVFIASYLNANTAAVVKNFVFMSDQLLLKLNCKKVKEMY